MGDSKLFYRVASCAALLSGCFHVSLGAAPPPTAPLATRTAAYARLRPVVQGQEITVATGRYGTSVTVDSTLTLADATPVTHADDLLSVLDPRTPAARAARASAAARTNKWLFTIGGGALMVGGMAYAFHDAWDGSDPAAELDNTQLAIGLGAATVGMVVSLIATFHYRVAEEQYRRTAFQTYDESLRQSLQLCVDGMNLVDCNAAPHVGPPGAVQP